MQHAMVFLWVQGEEGELGWKGQWGSAWRSSQCHHLAVNSITQRVNSCRNLHDFRSVGRKKQLRSKNGKTPKKERRLSEVGRRGAVGGEGKPSQLHGQSGILAGWRGKAAGQGPVGTWRQTDRWTDTRDLQQEGLMGKKST